MWPKVRLSILFVCLASGFVGGTAAESSKTFLTCTGREEEFRNNILDFFGPLPEVIWWGPKFLTSTLHYLNSSAEFQLAPWHPTRLFANSIAWMFIFVVPALYAAIFKRRRAHANTSLAINEEVRRHRKASNSLSTMINFIGWLLEALGLLLILVPVPLPLALRWMIWRSESIIFPPLFYLIAGERKRTGWCHFLFESGNNDTSVETVKVIRIYFSTQSHRKWF